MTKEEVYSQVLAVLPLGHPLLTMQPTDVGDFCPQYASFDESQRRAFWASLLTAIAKSESRFDPLALLWEGPNDPEYSIGLLQISPSNKRAYQCDFEVEADLVDPKHNLSCGVAILTKLVQRSHVIGGANSSTGHSGAAKYWSTLRIVPEKPHAAGTQDTRAGIIAELSHSEPCGTGGR
jgi:hypothetical protein